MDKDTLVIIPAFNEALSISRVVASITRLYPDVDVAVINDGSHDGTARLAKEAGASVLSHPFNMGYGVSLQTGYKLAVRNDYRYVVQIDGDGQHDLCVLRGTRQGERGEHRVGQPDGHFRPA